MQLCVYQIAFRNVYEFKKQLTKSGLVWSRTLLTLLSGGFRPGPREHSPFQFCSSPPPSFVATHNFFAKITQIPDLFAFPSFRKVGKFAALIESLKTKSTSASGSFAP